MQKKHKIIKFISSLILVLLIVPTVLLSKPKQADAIPVEDFLAHIFLGTTGASTATNTTLHIKDFATAILKEAIKTIEHKLLASVTQSTVNWINSGFSGSPLYVQNPTSFFKDIGKFEIKNLVDQFGYDPVRFPFGKSFALNTINSYQNTLANNAQYSLSKVIYDPVLLNNYRNNFNTGGWNGFLINTQYPQNNYLGYQMIMNNTLAQNLQGTTQNAAQKVQTTLQQGNGFLSPQTCPSNPSYNNGTNEFKQPSFDSSSVPYNVPDCISPVTGTSVACQNQADIDAAIASGGFVPSCVYNVNQSSSNTGCVNQDEITAALLAYNNAYDAAKSTWAKTNSCPGGLTSTTPGSVVGNQIMSALDSGSRLKELDSALGNSIGTILDSLMNHFMSQGLNALSGAVTGTSTSAPADTWSYNGNSLDGGTNIVGSQALNIPAAVSVKTASSTSTVITGGIAPYNISIQPDTTIATAQVNGSSLTVTGIAAGQTTVTVRDSSTQTATIQITTSKTGTLTIDFNNPSALKNITAAVSGTSLTMSGGIQPYNITTLSNSNVAMATISGGTLIIVGINPGTTSIILQDSSSSPKIVTLQITTGSESPISATPQSASVIAGSSANITLSGGIPPFTTTIPPNTSMATVSISGNTISVAGLSAGTTFVTIQDSFSPAETITIPITVTGSSALPIGTGTNGTF